MNKNLSRYLFESFFEGFEFFLLLGPDLLGGHLQVDVLLFLSLGNLQKKQFNSLRHELNSISANYSIFYSLILATTYPPASKASRGVY